MTAVLTNITVTLRLCAIKQSNKAVIYQNTLFVRGGAHTLIPQLGLAWA